MKLYKYVFFIIISIVILTRFAYSQITCLPSENVKYTISNWLKADKIDTISFTIHNSNPTVFYIDSIKINDKFLVNIERNYEITNCSANGLDLQNIDLVIYGIGLNTNDTITELKINNVTLNNKKLDSTISINVQVKNNIGHQYVKFAQITNIYPIPLTYHDDLNIDFIIDISMDINFTITDESGRMIEYHEIKNATKGKQKLQINLHNYNAGTYRIILKTDTGNHSSSFIVVN